MFEKEDNIRNVDADEAVSTEHDPINEKVVKRKFSVMSIDKTNTPTGMVGDNWYQYVVGQGSSEIQGLTMGTLNQVTDHANSVADDLNDRSKGKKTGYSTSQKKNIPAKPTN